MLEVANKTQRSNSPVEKLRLDVPRSKYVLSSESEKYGRGIREAVSLLITDLETISVSAIETVFVRPVEMPSKVSRTKEELNAWAVVSMWVLGVATKSISVTARLREAEEWFCGRKRLTSGISKTTVDSVEGILQSSANSGAYYELLPYILDPHGPGSRLSIRKNPKTKSARANKREDGVFYTPADVAEYMVNHCLETASVTSPVVFDPACGTGVFLRAALRDLSKKRTPNKYALAESFLFGVDIDPLVLDTSVFVLMSDLIYLETLECSPSVAWCELRKNFRCMDALKLDPHDEGTFQAEGRHNAVIDGRYTVTSLFPRLNKNPNIIVGNPPYSSLGDRVDSGRLKSLFGTISSRSITNQETYLIFLEQVVRLSGGQGCAGALVLPLSIACNVGTQFVLAREFVQNTFGKWCFAFFDREPHALFGEDVKTRNTIVFWFNDIENSISTTLLKKWRGNERETLFNSLKYTPVIGKIGEGIPKISGEIQAKAHGVLNSKWDRLSQAILSIDRVELSSALESGDNSVYVGPTAYNYLNVFLVPESVSIPEESILSEHPLYRIQCSNEKDRFIVFSLLVSDFCFWWWHVYGDGFHVTKRFLSDIPFGLEIFSEPLAGELACYGEELWKAVKDEPTLSVNRGKTTVSYSCNRHNEIRLKIDGSLVQALNFDDAFVQELCHFKSSLVEAKLSEPI